MTRRRLRGLRNCCARGELYAGENARVAHEENVEDNGGEGWGVIGGLRGGCFEVISRDGRRALRERYGGPPRVPTDGERSAVRRRDVIPAVTRPIAMDDGMLPCGMFGGLCTKDLDEVELFFGVNLQRNRRI